MKATAFMMDTKKWSAFAGNQYTTSGKQAQAIGGAPLELFVKSFNSVSSHTTKLTLSGSNSYGYTMPTNGDSAKIFGTETNMWYIKETDKVYRSCWLASPASTSKGEVFTAWSGGKFGTLSVTWTDLRLPPCSIYT